MEIMAEKKKLLLLTNLLWLATTALPAISQSSPVSAGDATTGDAHAGESSPTKSMQLTGGVEQKETITIPSAPATADRKALPQLTLEIPKLDIVPAVPKFLQAGTTFDQSMYPKEGNVWYKIPNFLAGHWICSEKTVTSSTNLLTGRENDAAKTEAFVSEVNQGFQTDSTGHIWHFDQAPFLGHARQADGQTHYSFVQEMKPLQCTDDKFVRRVILIKAEVNGSNVVKTSKQFDVIQSFTPFGSDKIREDNISRPIGAAGTGWESTSTVIFSLVRPYAPIKQNKGRDMQEMFREYLESNGLSSLIPKS